MKFLFLQGFRTLEDIRTKAHLNATQKIGLKHYDDFLDRMPRDEAAAIEAVVMDLYFDTFSSLSFSHGTTKLFVHIRDELGQSMRKKLTEICKKKAASLQKGLCQPPPALLVDGKSRGSLKKDIPEGGKRPPKSSCIAR